MKWYHYLAIFIVSFIFGAMCSPSQASEISGRWLDYYEEGDSIRKDGGVQVTTLQPEQRAGSYIKTGLWTWNIEKSAVTFKIKVSNWNDLKILTLILGNGIKLENAATFDIRKRFVNAPVNEWIEVAIPPSAWDIDGIVQWSKIDTILISVADNGKERISVQLKDVNVIPVAQSRAIVSISVDDGLKDTLLAEKEMSKFGFVGTAFIDSNKYIDDKHLSLSEINTLSQKGWDISGHNIGNLSFKNEEELTVHINETSEFLQQFVGSNLYALPNGSRNELILNTISQKFEYIFNIDGMSNVESAIIPKNINRQSVDKWTSPELVQSWIDNAIKNNEWVIINFHTFSDNLEKDEDWTLSNFIQMLEYINKSNITVLPISKVLTK